MALELVIVRHGEAQSGRAGIKDIDRTLTTDGIKGSQEIASKLLQEGFDPEAIYSSSAARAMHTALIFARVLKKKSSMIKLADDIYYGDAATLTEWITETIPGIRSLMIIGHNPGITELVSTLSQGRSTFMPPAGVTWFKFDTKVWTDIPKANLASFRFFAPSGGSSDE